MGKVSPVPTRPSVCPRAPTRWPRRAVSVQVERKESPQDPVMDQRRRGQAPDPTQPQVASDGGMRAQPLRLSSSTSSSSGTRCSCSARFEERAAVAAGGTREDRGGDAARAARSSWASDGGRAALGAVPSGSPTPPSDPSRCSASASASASSCAMRVAASSWVNRPPAWRWVSPRGPRASRKSLCPAPSTRASRSRSCRAVAGGPEGWPNAMRKGGAARTGSAAASPEVHDCRGGVPCLRPPGRRRSTRWC